jgi:hypothetical protein
VSGLAFDDWFASRNSGLSFDELHMQDGMRYDDTFRELCRQMRDYVSEMTNNKGHQE